MANIDGKIAGVSGLMGQDNGCEPVKVYDLRNHIEKIFSMDVSGTRFAPQNVNDANMEEFSEIYHFKCGAGYLFYNKSDSTQTYSIPNMAQGNLSASSARMTTLYPESFTIEGRGEFFLTSGYIEPGQNANGWYSDMPVYKTKNGAHKIWFDGSSYVLSSTIGNKTNSFTNQAVLPNVEYSDVHKTTSHFIEFSGFSGGASDSNGYYYEVGYYNGKKVYRHGKNGGKYYFFDGSNWVLADTPFNKSSCSITGSSDIYGKLDNSSGSNGTCYDGQVAFVRDGGIDPRSLATEDELSLMATEDELKVLITESDV